MGHSAFVFVCAESFQPTLPKWAKVLLKLCQRMGVKTLARVWKNDDIGGKAVGSFASLQCFRLEYFRFLLV